MPSWEAAAATCEIAEGSCRRRARSPMGHCSRANGIGHLGHWVSQGPGEPIRTEPHTHLYTMLLLVF